MLEDYKPGPRDCQTMDLKFAIFDSAFFSIGVVARGKSLLRIYLSEEDGLIMRKKILSNYPEASLDEAHFKALRVLLDRYLKGEKVNFDLDLDLGNLAPFTRAVLLETKKIPYGETRTYGDLASVLGFKSASRAVGQSLRINPLPIVIPCHRVIKKNGDLGGFSQGLRIKRKLLEIEGVRIEEIRHSP